MNSPFTEVGFSGPGKQAESTLGYARIPSPLRPFGDMPSGGWPAENDPARATSTPDLDNWGWDSWWTPQDWLQWHRALKQAYGQDEANRRFIIAWQEQGIGASPLNARSFDSGFREYARANGFLDGLYYGLGSLVRPIGTTTDVIGAVSDGVSTTASIAKWAIPVAAVTLGIMYFMANAPKRN